MKKALAILMVLATVAVAAYAEDAATYGNNAALAVSADATLTFGYDLETEASGFKNEYNWAVKIPLIAKQDFTHKGEGDAYATIEIDDVEFAFIDEEDTAGETNAVAEFDNGWTDGDRDIDEIIASLYFGKVYVTVNGGPDLSPNYADVWDPIKGDTEYYSFEKGPEAAAGTKIGYKDEKFEVAAKIASRMKMSANVDNEYSFGAYGKIIPSDMITVEAEGNFAGFEVADTAAKMSFGGKAEIKPIADLTITAGADAASINDEIEYDFIAKAAFKSIFSAGVYGGTMMTASTEDLDLAAFAKVSSADLVENLNAWFTFMGYNLLSEPAGDYGIPMAIHTGVNYKVAQNDVNYVKPFAEVWGQSNYVSKDDATKVGFTAAFNVGVEYGLFTNTIVTAQYSTGGTDDKDPLTTVVSCNSLLNSGIVDDKGRLTVAAKISY